VGFWTKTLTLQDLGTPWNYPIKNADHADPAWDDHNRGDNIDVTAISSTDYLYGTEAKSLKITHSVATPGFRRYYLRFPSASKWRFTCRMYVPSSSSFDTDPWFRLVKDRYGSTIAVAAASYTTTKDAWKLQQFEYQCGTHASDNANQEKYDLWLWADPTASGNPWYCSKIFVEEIKGYRE